MEKVLSKLRELSKEDIRMLWNWVDKIIGKRLTKEGQDKLNNFFQQEKGVEDMVYALEEYFDYQIAEHEENARKDARKDTKKEIIHEMLKEGDSLEKIARVVKMTVADVEKMVAEGQSCSK